MAGAANEHQTCLEYLWNTMLEKRSCQTAKENEILLPTEIYFFIFNRAKVESYWFSIAFKSLY